MAWNDGGRGSSPIVRGPARSAAVGAVGAAAGLALVSQLRSARDAWPPDTGTMPIVSCGAFRAHAAAVRHQPCARRLHSSVASATTLRQPRA